VLATCASVEGIEELFAASSNPGRIIGLNFFPPVYAASKIQVTIGSQTERLTAERVLHFISVLNKQAVVQGRSRSQA
jgi:3-hydroxyacyl-CoA dehydrogenase